MRPLRGQRSSCLQRLSNNCTLLPEVCQEEFVNTKVGLLTNSEVHYRHLNGTIRVCSAKTQLIRWEDASVVYFGDLEFKAREMDLTNVHVLSHQISYDEYRENIFEEPVESADINVVMHKKLWGLKKSMDNFAAEVSASPFFANKVIVIAIAVAIIIAAQ